MSRFVNPVPQFYLNNGDIASAGKLYFYETGTTTKKDTYSNFAQSIKNTNPVILSGEGRCPNIFGSGRYTVVFKDSGDIEQWTRDDVELSVEIGQYADWSPILTYRINDIVRGSDGEYYRSITSTNTGNDPTTSAANWEEIAFLSFWNTNVSYSQNDLVLFGGAVYRSEVNSNSGNQPDESSTDTWKNLSEPSAWVTTITYQIGDLVVYDSSIYESAVNSNAGNQPDTSPAQWTIINTPTSRQIIAGRGLDGGGDLTQDRTINTSRFSLELTGDDYLINQNFDGVYWFNGASLHILSIGTESVDEGATETVIICRETATSDVRIELLGTTAVWAFDESVSINNYEVKPGEIVRLVKVAANSYLAYADYGVSEVVTLGGDFDAGQGVICRRIGKNVWIDGVGEITFPASSAPQSAAGAIPAMYRPLSDDKFNVFFFSAGGIIQEAKVLTTGTLGITIVNFSGTLTNSTGTVVSPSISYQID